MESQKVAQSAIEGGIYTAIGVGVAQATGLFNPMGGALFGGVTYLSGKVIAEGMNKSFGNSSSEKILKVAAEYFGGLLLALGVMIQIGYKIQLSASVTLGLWMIPLTYAATQIALPMIMKQVS